MGTLEELRARLGGAAILLDFDGTLAPIVPRPEDAAPLPAAAATLASLAKRARVVAVITGRPASFVHRVLPVPALEVIGVYGAEAAPPLDDGVIRAVTAAAAAVPGATVEDKRVSVAVHVRGVDDAAAIAALEEALRDHRRGPRPRVVRREARDRDRAARPAQGRSRHADPRSPRAGGRTVRGGRSGGRRCDSRRSSRCRDHGVPVLRIAVRGSETPDALLAAADLSVEGPEGLLAVLAGL